MSYPFRLAARVLLYAQSHRQDSTYHGRWYTSRGALAGTKNSSVSPPWRTDPTTHHTMSEHTYHRATSRSFENEGVYKTSYIAYLMYGHGVQSHQHASGRSRGTSLNIH